jgi:hypothetical protein
VRLHEREADRVEEGVDDDRSTGHSDQSISPAPGSRGCSFASVPPWDRHAETDEDQPSHGGQASGEVAPGWSFDGDVCEVQRAVDEGEDPEDERQPGAQAGTQEGKRQDPCDADGERDEGGQSVLVGAHPARTVHERVVKRVQEGECGRAAEEKRRPCVPRSGESVTTPW